ncbi:kinase-like domain-containing protein [Podospora didyma]|uniref:Kinase-like domain-containing protein n=1 Tax=Podospora didyma TaxID=330526 RepID=A0AAE0P0W4_9PEZI|nr:kinase-like domain-containing protein [Podospora didyma]
MEICEHGEIFVERDDDLIFDHTKIILRDANDEYFYAKTNQRMTRVSIVDVNGLDTTRIPADHIWPLANPKFTRAPDPLPPTSYLKRPRLLYYGLDDLDCGNQILTEVEACEVLKRYPHPNIAPYLGCIVKEGRIRGLAFARYSVTLSQMLKDETPFDRGHCLCGIEAGVRHMHKLGLVHNDLNPSNIMMDGDNPVIIDFDSCKREGDELGSKAGTDGWTLNGQDQALRENDLYSLSKIRAALMKA